MDKIEPTKGEWKLFYFGNTIEIQDSKGRAIVHWAGFDSGDKPFKTKLANAEHIIACVNAQQGGMKWTRTRKR